jgi:hypothetical protein
MPDEDPRPLLPGRPKLPTVIWYSSFQGVSGAVGTLHFQRKFIEEDYAASKFTFQERIKELLDPGIIEAPLTRENYKVRFHNMICWEEKRHVEILDTK